MLFIAQIHSKYTKHRFQEWKENETIRHNMALAVLFEFRCNADPDWGGPFAPPPAFLLPFVRILSRVYVRNSTQTKTFVMQNNLAQNYPFQRRRKEKQNQMHYAAWSAWLRQTCLMSLLDWSNYMVFKNCGTTAIVWERSRCEMEMKTLSHVVLLVLILIEAGKASKREFNTRRDFTERVDAMEKSLGLLKEGFSSLSLLVADLMKGVKKQKWHSNSQWFWWI